MNKKDARARRSPQDPAAHRRAARAPAGRRAGRTTIFTRRSSRRPGTGCSPAPRRVEADVRKDLKNGGNKAAAATVVSKRIAAKAKAARHRGGRVRPLGIQISRPREGAGRRCPRRRSEVLAPHNGRGSNMAKPMGRQQSRQQQDDRGDGLREKMISINRVTKVVKGGRILAFAALDGRRRRRRRGSAWAREGRRKSRSRCRRRWKRRAAG